MCACVSTYACACGCLSPNDQTSHIPASAVVRSVVKPSQGAPYNPWAAKGLQKIYNILALIRNTITKQLAPDSSQNELSIDLLNVQIGCTEVPLA